MIRVVIAEDEAELREEIVEYLCAQGISATGKERGAEVLEFAAQEKCDVAVLDIGLPDISGLEVAYELRKMQPIGLIMLTARGMVSDRVAGYDAGADLYMVKPTDLRELVAAIRSLARRLETEQAAPSTTTPVEDLDDSWRLDKSEWTLFSPGQEPVRLTATEYMFLAKLANSSVMPVSRSDISVVMGYPKTYDPRALDAVVRRLRRKVEEMTKRSLPVKAVHGVGYAFTGVISCD